MCGLLYGSRDMLHMHNTIHIVTHILLQNSQMCEIYHMKCKLLVARLHNFRIQILQHTSLVYSSTERVCMHLPSSAPTHCISDNEFVGAFRFSNRWKVGGTILYIV